MYEKIENDEIFSFGRNEKGQCGIETNDDIEEIKKEVIDNRSAILGK